MAFCRGKNRECAACLKYSVLEIVEKIYKMGCLEGSGTPVLSLACDIIKERAISCLAV